METSLAPEPSEAGCLVVTGMHRSGTSLLASFLRAAGINLGENLYPADEFNPLGYFEDLDFLELQREMMLTCTIAESGWRDWGWTESQRLDFSRLPSFRSRAEALVRRRNGAAQPWGWKDPRTTILLDFWDQILPSARYVFIYRAPWEVAASMAALPSSTFREHPDYAPRIWCFYNRKVMDFYRRHRDRCLLIAVTSLLSRPDELLALIRSKLGLPIQASKDGAAILRSLRGHGRLDATASTANLWRLSARSYPREAQVWTELEQVADLASGLPLPAEPAAPVDTRSATQTSPTTSVVISCFNQGELVLAAVASVENSEDAAVELVIVNDGSTDPFAMEILERLRAAGYRILDQPHRGVGAARNAGIRATRGRHILLLDAANRIPPSYLRRAADVLDAAPEVGVVYSEPDSAARAELVTESPELPAPEGPAADQPAGRDAGTVTADDRSPLRALDAGISASSAVAGTFSCVVDAHPRFHLDALRWFASLTRLAGVDPRDLVVHAIGPAQTDVLQYLHAQGVAIREIEPFDARSPHCNKISGALRLAAEKPQGLSVLTDTDIVVFEDPRRLRVPSDQVGMTPVHMANPPFAVLTTVFAAAGLPLPPSTALQLQPGESTAAGNGNGGLYLVPGALLAAVAQAWAQWARWLLARRELLAAWAIHVDQVAMALALAAERIETFELDVHWNLPTSDPSIIPADPPIPAIIHYRQQVDPVGRLLATGFAAIDRRIQDANAVLGDIWREAFPNATFWEWRYLTNPDLGSGVGSRGKPLHDKRALLAVLLDVLRPASTLDVGCGDGEATSGLSVQRYVGLDLSAEAVRRARASRPDGDYRVGTLADHPVQADLTVCLDVLIHQADAAIYDDLVGRLLRSSTRALVLSGYEQPIPTAFPTVHFHEPLSTTIRRFEPEAELYPLREQHQITTLLVLKAPANRHPRDSRARLLPALIEMLVQRAALISDLQAQRDAFAAESDRRRCENERLAEEKHALTELLSRMSAELERWRERVAAMEGSRAWRLRALLLRWRLRR